MCLWVPGPCPPPPPLQGPMYTHLHHHCECVCVCLSSPLPPRAGSHLHHHCKCVCVCLSSVPPPPVQGPTYTITVNGGECEILDDGSVECEPPFVELSETPFVCNLPYRKAAELEVRDGSIPLCSCCWCCCCSGLPDAPRRGLHCVVHLMTPWRAVHHVAKLIIVTIWYGTIATQCARPDSH
jgi:hypothetical protein